MICRFCKTQGNPILKENVSKFNVLQIIETKPVGWLTIDRLPWCGKCDPRKSLTPKE